MIRKYWKGFYNKNYITLDHARQLSKRTENKRGCCIWLSRFDAKDQPVFYEHERKHDVNVRPFLADKILNKQKITITMKCNRRDCVAVRHMVLWRRSVRLTNVKTEETLKRLTLLYPLTYLKDYYKISKYKLKEFKKQISGALK